jgi:hypothetical protein
MANDPNWRLPDVPEFSVTSPDFSEGDPLPMSARSGIAGAGGDDRSPELRWSGAPADTRSYVVTVYDPDAPTGSGFWHWAVYDIPATSSGLAADSGSPGSGLLPAGAVTVSNEFRMPRYLGAAPPSGHGQHRYVFTVSAIDVDHLDIDEDATPAVLGFTLRDHLVGRAQLMGTSETP